jgi:hypothetical protein
MLLAVLTLPAGAQEAAGPGPEIDLQAVLRQADEARGNLGGVSWKVAIESVENERRTEKSMDVKARGFDVLAETLSPRKYKGQKILMREGTMWFYKPDLSRPAPVSQRQKMMGSASYGDVAATNYSVDYDPTRLEDETVDDEVCYVLDLKARTKSATYDRIKYWVSQERNLGIRAEYFTVSGKKFKSARMYYENEVADKDGNPMPFVSRMVITDDITEGTVTTMVFSEPNLEAIRAGVFDVNLLVR